MSPDQYQQRALWTAVYPEAGTGSVPALTYCALGLGEAGEVQGKVKKIMRGDVRLEDQRDALLDGLGDVLRYVAVMAWELKCPLEDLMERNLAKLVRRAKAGAIRGAGDDRA